MYFTAAFLASLLVSVHALAPLHSGQSMHRRHQHAALAKVRAPSPEPILSPLEASPVVSKKQLRKRCKPRTTSTAASHSAPSAPINVAPAPSSHASPTPVTTSVQAPVPSPPSSSSITSPSSTPAAPPAPSASSVGNTHTGQGTWYATGLNACGTTNNDEQFIVAVSHLVYDGFEGYNGGNPNNNPVCNKKINAQYNGSSVSVTVSDRCVGCGQHDLDFSPAAFKELADPAIGRLFGLMWSFET